MKREGGLAATAYGDCVVKTPLTTVSETGEGMDRRLVVKAGHTSYAGLGTMRVDAPARAEDPPPSPVPAAFVHDEIEMIELMPIAFTQLRITFFPWTKGAKH